MSKIVASDFLFGDHVDGILVRVLFAHMGKLAFGSVTEGSTDLMRRHMPVRCVPRVTKITVARGGTSFAPRDLPRVTEFSSVVAQRNAVREVGVQFKRFHPEF